MAIKRRIAATHQVTAILYHKEDYKKDNFGTFVFLQLVHLVLAIIQRMEKF